MREFPHFDEAYAKLGNDNFEIITLNTEWDQPAKASTWKMEDGKDYDWVWGRANRAMWDKYQVFVPADKRGRIPASFIIDKNGVIQDVHVGGLETDDILKVVKPLLN